MKKALAIILALTMLVGTATAFAEGENDIAQQLIEAAKNLPKSENLYFTNGLSITGMGIHYNNYPKGFDGCYYWPAIESLTGAHIEIDWRVEADYITQVADKLASQQLPDIMVAGAYGVMNLVNKGVAVALDEYLDLMPNIVAAVGEDRMAYWRQADGHIYTIPTVVNVPGSQSVMIRQDWLDDLNMSAPETWDQWVELWRAIKANDLNGNGDPNDEIPLALEQGTNGERCMASLLNAFGIRASSSCQFCVLDDGTYTMVYEHPRYKEFLQAVQDLFAEGLIDREFTTRTQNELFTAMDSNLVGTTMTWAERAQLSTYAIRDGGDEDALWTCVAPITGPYGDQMTQERTAVSSVWCITSAAEEAGKVEDIIKLFDWNFSKEGNNLYNYGIEGVSYDIVNGEPIMRNELVKDSITGYRLVGCEYEPFGGEWQTSAFMQALFRGARLDELDDASASFYKGLAIINNGRFYAMPQTLGTDAYVEFRDALITNGVCTLRDQTIAGQMSVDDFFAKYEELKTQGLQRVIDEGAAAYASILGN